MLQWFHRLMPRQGDFFSLFERHAGVMVSTARALRRMLSSDDEVKLRFQDIIALEHEADGITREVLILLRTTFITPFAGSIIVAWVLTLPAAALIGAIFYFSATALP